MTWMTLTPRHSRAAVALRAASMALAWTVSTVRSCNSTMARSPRVGAAAAPARNAGPTALGGSARYSVVSVETEFNGLFTGVRAHGVSPAIRRFRRTLRLTGVRFSLPTAGRSARPPRGANHRTAARRVLRTAGHQPGDVHEKVSRKRVAAPFPEHCYRR